MTNELEKQFFDTFGIEPRGKKCTCDVRDFAKCTTYYCTSCAKALKKEYPRITPEILLELICIDNQENIYKYRPLANNVEELKTYILEEFIRLHELGLFKRVNQVRTLFEEER